MNMKNKSDLVNLKNELKKVVAFTKLKKYFFPANQPIFI